MPYVTKSGSNKRKKPGNYSTNNKVQILTVCWSLKRTRLPPFELLGPATFCELLFLGENTLQVPEEYLNLVYPLPTNSTPKNR